MTPENLIDILNVIERGHFVTGCGDHTTDYVHKEKIFLRPLAVTRFCSTIEERFQDFGIQVVVGLDRWGPLLSYATTLQFTLMSGCAVFTACAQKQGKTSDGRDKLVLKEPARSMVAGKRALIVEDVVTTGYNLVQVAKEAQHAGGEVVATAALILRGEGKYMKISDVGTPYFFPVVTRKLSTWSEEECQKTGPCFQGIPVNTDLGHGAEFLARQKQ
ncbi:MAG: phosphoribosyltransferase family protein [Patescibacteria group bacterium]